MGWQAKSSSPQISCHGFYVKEYHILPECKHSLTDLNFIARSYEALNADEKARVPDKYYLAAKTLLMENPGHTLAQEVKETIQPKNEQGACRN